MIIEGFFFFCLPWFTDDFDELVVSNNDVVLKNIAEDLRDRLPIEAMLNSEHQAVQKVSWLLQTPFAEPHHLFGGYAYFSFSSGF